jgi:osmoprotectant transport system substrate-binding protein
LRTRGIQSVLAAGLLFASATFLAACGGGTPTGPPKAARYTTTTALTTATAPLPGAARPAITIGDKNYAEQFVLGQLYAQALTAQGFQVNVDRNIGTTAVTMQALLAGTLDMYPEYVDTWNTQVASDAYRYPTMRAALAAGRLHASAQGFALLDPSPFSDVDAVAVTPAYAKANSLRSIADLVSVASQLTFGGPLQFRTSDPGLGSIEHAYGVVPAGYDELDIGDQLNALDRGDVQAAVVQSTDGQLQTGQYELLDDPHHIFGWGNVVPVVPVKVLDAEGPVFIKTVNAVTALLTTPIMRQLNADVELSGMDPATVAKRFLEANGLVTPGS